MSESPKMAPLLSHLHPPDSSWGKTSDSIPSHGLLPLLPSSSPLVKSSACAPLSPAGTNTRPTPLSHDLLELSHFDTSRPYNSEDAHQGAACHIWAKSSRAVSYIGHLDPTEPFSTWGTNPRMRIFSSHIQGSPVGHHRLVQPPSPLVHDLYLGLKLLFMNWKPASKIWRERETENNNIGIYLSQKFRHINDLGYHCPATAGCLGYLCVSLYVNVGGGRCSLTGVNTDTTSGSILHVFLIPFFFFLF